jgi:cytochrome P450
MANDERCPIVDFDHNSQEHSTDPVASYRKLREANPVAWTEAHGGYWVFSDYDSVFEAARDDETFSSARNSYGGEGLTVVIPKTPMHLHIPIELDPPEFRKYRRIVNPIAAPAAVERMHGMIRRYTTWFIDQVIESGECDFAQVIGVPSIVTVDWLGLPVSDWKRYSFAHHAVLAAVPGSEDWERATKVELPYLSQQMREVIAARRASPREDLISYLVQQEVDDRPVTDEEVFSMIELILAGGVGTTASLVSQTLVWLYQHPDVRQRLAEHPEMLERAIEEFLRYFSPTQALARTVAKETDFHGSHMRIGDRVLLAWGSANRDPSQFEDPDTLDVERWPNRHTAFGVGVHRCLGSHLGRAMAREMLGQILERMPDYVIDMERLQPYSHQGTNTGFQRIPARFTPGPRRGEDIDLGEAFA